GKAPLAAIDMPLASRPNQPGVPEARLHVCVNAWPLPAGAHIIAGRASKRACLPVSSFRSAAHLSVACLRELAEAGALLGRPAALSSSSRLVCSSSCLLS